jgi:dTDP-4-dehydrorhamnose 3,5-epimerase
MSVHETEIRGLFACTGVVTSDDRGVFAKNRFGEHGGPHVFRDDALIAYSVNPATHTLRGMHLEAPPSSQWKFVCCVAGGALDVVCDPRPDSETFGRHLSMTLSPANVAGWLIAPGLAHGYLTLEPNTVMVYLLSTDQSPELAQGLRYDDPLFSVPWPTAPVVISQKDAGYGWLDLP